MQVNIQHVFDQQKENFDYFIELKTLILSIIPRILNVYQVKKQGGCVNSNKYGINIGILIFYIYHPFKMWSLHGCPNSKK